MLIGILGGAGVAATNLLNHLIELEYTCHFGAIRDCDHPEIITWQATSAPSRSMFLEGRGPSFIEDYVHIVKKLHALGCDKIFMNCNTAHFAFDEIKKQSQAPLVNLVEETVKRTAKISPKRVGLLASDGCLQGKVYERYFKKYIPQAQIIYPDAEHQRMVTQGICNVKNQHRFDESCKESCPEHLFSEVCNDLRRQGADKIILGCTDIRVGFRDQSSDLIDSLFVMRDLIVEVARKE